VSFPAIVKGYKTKSMQDVSLAFLVVIIVGTILWIFYGLLNQDYIFLLANSVILIFAICLTAMKITYERNKKKAI